MRRWVVPSSIFAWDRIREDIGDVPVIPFRRVFGVAIAPESEVRAVYVQPQAGHEPIALLEGAPLSWDVVKSDLRVRALDYTSGTLVVVVAEEPEEVAHLPTFVASRARLHLHGDLRGRVVRLHRPRGIVHALCRYTVTSRSPTHDEFELDAVVTVRELHLDGSLGLGLEHLAVELGTYTGTPDAQAERLCSVNDFAGDVLEVAVNAYQGTGPMTLVVSLSGFTAEPTEPE